MHYITLEFVVLGLSENFLSRKMAAEFNVDAVESIDLCSILIATLRR